ncbi:hypothetical protein OSB04_013730 [Centaurea solstitialis]|uniref:MD-2-related lipid-recognition domain-containing protein n=1 Tax=Centaurea solstitialis TaxID=347529 RepID=A0AA38WRF6_9ASTR|nr:hypothetical protein OSB04_013730 [Centaurea solstitialis]
MEGIRIKILLYSIFIIAPSIYATDFKYCKKKEYVIKVKEVVVAPDPITRGTETSFTISAYTDKPISGGKVVIDVAYFGWNVYSQTGDLCDKSSCPIPAGDFAISHSQLLPTFAPPGSYTLSLKMQDGNKNELTCIKFSFSIGFLNSEGLVDS